MELNEPILQYMVNHVFLPPKLPQAEEPDSPQMDHRLLLYVTEASQKFISLLDHTRDDNDLASIAVWKRCSKMLQVMSRLQQGQYLVKEEVETALSTMKVQDVLPLYIASQNAGVIFRKIKSDLMTFEAFGLSMPAEIVMSHTGKISKTFPPNPRLSFPIDSTTYATLANTLWYLSCTAMDDAIPKTKKAGAYHRETRDVNSPRYIIEALSGIIRAAGYGLPAANTTYIQKRLDDHVLWHDALKPWRRSSIWLLVRVALQTTLDEAKIHQSHGYKAFMASLMSMILDKVTEHNDRNPPCDLLRFMNAKLARRLAKMGDVIEDDTRSTLSTTLKTVYKISSILETRWREIRQRAEERVQWVPPTDGDSQSYLDVTFRNSNSYLQGVIRRRQVLENIAKKYNKDATERELRSACAPRPTLNAISLPPSIPQQERYIALHDFEMWVQDCLPAWVTLSHWTPQFQALASTIDHYRQTASDQYKGDPLQLSVMHLCILELWVALDTIVLQWCPLLKEYSPEIPEDLLDPLLLSSLPQMERLHKVQMYLHDRHQQAKEHGGLSISDDVNSSRSFSNRFFKTSLATPLIALQRRICEDANREREAKRREIQEKNASYDKLMEEARQMSCNWVTLKNRWGDPYEKHVKRKCHKCSRETRARNMKIEPFEEPLPFDALHSQPIVFELECPLPFAAWRDATIKLLRAVQSPIPKSSKELYAVEEYAPLTRYFKSAYPGCQVGLASSTKPLKRSHYGQGVSFPVTEDEVITKNAGQFAIYDRITQSWLDKTLRINFRSECTLQLEGVYAPLQPFINNTTHTPNTAIASKNACPKEIALDEYHAYTHLRSGNRLQWLNLVRAIRVQSLHFTESAVFILVIQSIWQAGPIGDGGIHREAHVDLESERFGDEILDELDYALKSLGTNWKQSLYLATIVAVALKVADFSPHLSIKLKAQDILKASRAVVQNWIKALIDPQDQPSGQTPIQLRQSIAGLAVVLRFTFDSSYRSEMRTDMSKDDIVMYIYSGSIANSVNQSCLPHGLRLLMQRDKITALDLEDLIQESCRQDPSILDDVVSILWSDHNPSREWKCLQEQAGRWWTTDTRVEEGDVSRKVHFNILEGSLLIDGRMPDRLPAEYLKHPTYVALFGDNASHDVMPSRMRGMSYHLSSNGREIHLQLLNGQLIIRRRIENRIEEYIPTTIVEEDLPVSLTSGHHYWYIEVSKKIEIRPIAQTWKPKGHSSSFWIIEIRSSNNTMQGRISQKSRSDRNTERRLIDPHSSLYRSLSHALRPLEPSPVGLFVTSQDGLISIHIPRHDLSFQYDKKGKLGCNSIPGYILSERWDGIGSLFGLSTLLCLCPENEQSNERKILVPKGALHLNYGRYGYPELTIDVKDQKGYYLYDVDKIVGRLVGTRSVESDLYLTLLHALTSGFLEDPLTGRSGTSEALDRLSSASPRSIINISEESRKYLDVLAALTPSRSFYPVHLRVMETVKWNPHLPVSSQHPKFRLYVTDILRHWQETLIFHKKTELVKNLEEAVGESYLGKRAALRAWHYSPGIDDKGDLNGSIQGDFDSLSSQDSQAREHQAFAAALLTNAKASSAPIRSSLLPTFTEWRTLSGVEGLEWADIEHWLKVPKDMAMNKLWCTLFELCRKSEWPPSFQITMSMGFLGFSGVPTELLATLVAVIRELKFKSPIYTCPQFSMLDLDEGSEFKEPDICRLLRQPENCISFDNSAENEMEQLPDETNQSRHERAMAAYDLALGQQIDQVAASLRQYFPTVPVTISVPHQRLVQPSQYYLTNEIRPLLHRWSQNRSFKLHVAEVETLLQTITLPSPLPISNYYTPGPPKVEHGHSVFNYPTLVDLLRLYSSTLAINTKDPIDDNFTSNETVEGAAPSSDADWLLRQLEGFADNTFQRVYLSDLRSSLRRFVSSTSNTQRHVVNKGQLFSARIHSQRHLQERFNDIKHVLSPRNTAEKLLMISGLWPTLTPFVLLRQLSISHRSDISRDCLSILVQYAVLIHDAKRLDRIFGHFHAGRELYLVKELEYFREWNPMEYPDWLLVEIDGNFSIRQDQADLAKEMIHPGGNKNVAYQLNMGEGKSSVIAPIVSTHARRIGTLIARVIVPRAQTKQQFQILRQTLTGLCDRPLIYLPFDRQVPISVQSAKSIRTYLESFAEAGGVWLCEPEQILSLKLLGLDKLMRNPEDHTGRQLAELQTWLHKCSADTLDEVDEVLHTRQQVIYTVGDQRDFDAAPQRWEVVQKLLTLFARHLKHEASEESLSSFLVEYPEDVGAFPHIRIQSENAREEIRRFMRTSLEKNEWPLPQHLCDISISYITTRSSPQVENDIISNSEGEIWVRELVLCLRGMVGSDLLYNGLMEKRWRVHYGLDLKREPFSPLAVPYRAKDCPSQRSEFAHPDMTILLTCLSYYYGGLDDDMAWLSIIHLLNSDNPDLTYSEWLRPFLAKVPPELRTIRGVNMEDNAMLKATIFPLLKFNKAAIDFYLNAFVFPRYAKEFPSKLSSSGWDLAIVQDHATAGFSGTNDGRFLLPTTIQQMERPAQQHTNGKVLSYMLRSENKTVKSCPNFISSKDILRTVHSLPSAPKVILDVGALVLDASNLKFSRQWLALYEEDSGINAVIFFDNSDNLMVLTRDGSTQAFIDSPYSNRLDQCLVYLDEAHTRGTDLRLPDGQAVVTLGPKLTKDKLVQGNWTYLIAGCMRMRKLGHGHSLVFLATEEVIQLIRDATGRPANDKITTFDVMVWAIRETWRQLQLNLPTWAAQGLSFVRRDKAWRQISPSHITSQEVEDLFCEPESKTLLELYGLKDIIMHPPEDIGQEVITQDVLARCEEFGSLVIRDGAIHEEMEVELVHEKEVEREVERPPPADPCQHSIHTDVKSFVSTGVMPRLSKAFLSVRNALIATSLDIPAGTDALFRDIMVTKDFYHTIQLRVGPGVGDMDQFLRPVEWLVTSTVNQGSLAVALSPYEVNELLPLLRVSTNVRLHPFHPHSNLSVRSLNGLDFCVIPYDCDSFNPPSDLLLPLNLFSGSLYIRDHKTYKDVCAALRLCFDSLPHHLSKPEIITSSYFVKNASTRLELGMTGSGFVSNPLPFLRKLLTLRRNGRSLGPSHMGKLLYGVKLFEEDFV